MLQGGDTSAGQLPENIGKNRYRDVLPYEVSTCECLQININYLQSIIMLYIQETRVLLNSANNSTGNDYINASFVNVSSFLYNSSSIVAIAYVIELGTGTWQGTRMCPIQYFSVACLLPFCVNIAKLTWEKGPGDVALCVMLYMYMKIICCICCLLAVHCKWKEVWLHRGPRPSGTHLYRFLANGVGAESPLHRHGYQWSGTWWYSVIYYDIVQFTVND